MAREGRAAISTSFYFLVFVFVFVFEAGAGHLRWHEKVELG